MFIMVRALSDTWKPPGLAGWNVSWRFPRELNLPLNCPAAEATASVKGGGAGEASERTLDGAPKRRLAGLCHDLVFQNCLHRKPSEFFALVQTLTNALVRYLL
jgi:hypothetical protein